MSSLHTRLLSIAALALTAAGCGLEIGATLDAQQVTTGGDPDVTSRRLFDVDAMRLEGMDAVTPSPDGSFIALSRRDATPRTTTLSRSRRAAKERRRW